MISDERKEKEDTEWRAPGWVVPILCAGLGYFMADIAGAVLAGLLGVGVWRMRG